MQLPDNLHATKIEIFGNANMYMYACIHIVQDIIYSKFKKKNSNKEYYNCKTISSSKTSIEFVNVVN